MDTIPNFTAERKRKAGYTSRDATIDTSHPLHNDPLVDPRESEFGFTDARSYYAKPNRMTGETLPGVPDAPLVRLDLARRLVEVEEYLRTSQEVRGLLGAPARLRIDDALRPYEAQKFAFNVAWPAVIRRAHPTLTDEQIAIEVSQYCADPGEKPSPTPHLTGGAVDVALINVETDQPFDRGYKGGQVAGSAFPDFHEGYHLQSGQSDIVNSAEQLPVEPETSEVVLGRRVLYWAMTKIGGLSVNPHEIWHYGVGDPLSAHISRNYQPYYGVAELPEWYQAQLKLPQ